MVQITQTLSATIKPTHGFEMPLIYIPEEASHYAGNRKMPDNQLYNLCDMLEKKLSVKV